MSLASATPQTAQVSGLFRYPIKGLSPEPLQTVTLTPGETVPGDRVWAFENGGPRFDPDAPAYLPKIAFLMLMGQERLAALHSAYDPDTGRLIIRRGEAVVCDAVLTSPDGQAAAERFFQDFMGEDARGAIRLVRAPGHSFSDVPAKWIHIVNLASVAALSEALGADLDPVRFRANMHLSGLAPWVEQAWVGRILTIGAVRLRVTLETERCAATTVNPQTASRDAAIPAELLRRYGHQNFGVYAEVIDGGDLRVGDRVSIGG